MIRTLSRHGNSYALVIEKPILDLLGITPETLLEVTTDGKSLKIEPRLQNATGEDVKDAADEAVNRFGATFKRLGDG
jgi:antitoxin component of MazEF toxin-antitoxin module